MVRQQWVGLILEGGPISGLTAHGLLTTNQVRVSGGFWADKERALETLEKSSPAAADWFRENSSPFYTDLIFGADEAVPVVNEGIS